MGAVRMAWLRAAAMLAACWPTLLLGQVPQVTFDGESYTRRFEQRQGDIRLVEYTRDGETLKEWTRLVAARHFLRLTDPRAAALELARTVRQHNPQARADVIAKDDGTEAIVDFLTWAPGEDRLEFNVHRYRKVPGKPGLVAWQFAWRFRSSELADPAATVRANRKRFVDAMLRADWPDPFVR